MRYDSIDGQGVLEATIWQARRHAGMTDEPCIASGYILLGNDSQLPLHCIVCGYAHLLAAWQSADEGAPSDLEAHVDLDVHAQPVVHKHRVPHSHHAGLVEEHAEEEVRGEVGGER